MHYIYTYLKYASNDVANTVGLYVRAADQGHAAYQRFPVARQLMHGPEKQCSYHNFLGCSGDLVSRPGAWCSGYVGILSGLTKSTEHPS